MKDRAVTVFGLPLSVPHRSRLMVGPELWIIGKNHTQLNLEMFRTNECVQQSPWIGSTMLDTWYSQQGDSLFVSMKSVFSFVAFLDYKHFSSSFFSTFLSMFYASWINYLARIKCFQTCHLINQIYFNIPEACKTCTSKGLVFGVRSLPYECALFQELHSRDFLRSIRLLLV